MTLLRFSRSRALAGILVSLAGCAGTSEPPPVARAYLDQLIGVMESNSLHRLTINWPAFRAEVFAAAGSARTIPDTYPAITTALRLLGDGHSSYRNPDGTFLYVPNRTCQASGAPRPANVPASIGYVKVGAFSGTATQASAFASAITDSIRLNDRDNLVGWVVDLRGNGGGNMWPMIAGVGPVLGEGVLGWFVDPVGAEVFWEYRDGASRNGGVDAQRVDAPYTLKRPNPKVAVLVDNGVASSGEATFIAFIKRPNTRSFGVATCGLSTANRGITLSDGAILNLTGAVMADRTKAKYGDRVQPDEIVQGQAAVVDRAIAWLLSSNQ